jgi:hypothetical protein
MSLMAVLYHFSYNLYVSKMFKIKSSEVITPSNYEFFSNVRITKAFVDSYFVSSYFCSYFGAIICGSYFDNINKILSVLLIDSGWIILGQIKQEIYPETAETLPGIFHMNNDHSWLVL